MHKTILSFLLIGASAMAQTKDCPNCWSTGSQAGWIGADRGLVPQTATAQCCTIKPESLTSASTWPLAVVTKAAPYSGGLIQESTLAFVGYTPPAFRPMYRIPSDSTFCRVKLMSGGQSGCFVFASDLIHVAHHDEMVIHSPQLGGITESSVTFSCLQYGASGLDVNDAGVAAGLYLAYSTEHRELFNQEWKSK